jgi:hypothetical protein
MKTPHKHAALIKAWADGAEIEYFYRGYSAEGKIVEKWVHLLAAPCWTPSIQYRIKPETFTVTIPRPKFIFKQDGVISLCYDSGFENEVLAYSELCKAMGVTS